MSHLVSSSCFNRPRQRSLAPLSYLNVFNPILGWLLVHTSPLLSHTSPSLQSQAQIIQSNLRLLKSYSKSLTIPVNSMVTKLNLFPQKLAPTLSYVSFQKLEHLWLLSFFLHLSMTPSVSRLGHFLICIGFHQQPNMTIYNQRQQELAHSSPCLWSCPINNVTENSKLGLSDSKTVSSTLHKNLSSNAYHSKSKLPSLSLQAFLILTLWPCQIFEWVIPLSSLNCALVSTVLPPQWPSGSMLI